MSEFTREFPILIEKAEELWINNMSYITLEREFDEVLDLMLSLQTLTLDIEKDVVSLEKREVMKGYVYLMKFGTGFYKIGFSNRPVRRQKEKARNEQGLSVEVSIVHIIDTDDMDRLEKDVAKLFNLSSTYIGAEMWDLTPGDLAKFCSVGNVIYGDLFSKGMKIF